MSVVNVKEFCKRTGFPLAMIRAYCREGKITHWKRGRVYLFDENEAIKEIMQLKDVKVYKRRPVNNKPLVERRKVASGVFDYQAEIARLQSQCKSNARRDDNKKE